MAQPGCWVFCADVSLFFLLYQRMGVTSVFNVAGVDTKRFLQYTQENPATYRDWSRVWDQQTTGKEDDLKTPYLDTQFVDAEAQGVIPKVGI